MATVNLRVVDATAKVPSPWVETTISDVTDGKVKPQTGPERDCDGTNNNENPFPGPTCTNVLHKGTKGNWDG